MRSCAAGLPSLFLVLLLGAIAAGLCWGPAPLAAAGPLHLEKLPPAGAEGAALHPAVARTDARDIAGTRARLGSRPGTYTFGATLAGAAPGTAPLAFQAQARAPRWWLSVAFGLLGGLAIFLYGMGQMSEGMKNALGGRMRTLLGRLTHNRLLAVAVGALVTMVIQSSSATTVMLVGFVQARLMSFAQTLGIILGARIGTTLTAQIIAFRLTDVALLFVAAGFAVMLFARAERWKYGGQALMGFGLLFFGMRVMAESMEPLRTYAPFVGLIVALEWPPLGIVLGAALTALMQSSSAFTGILIVLASQGLLTLPGAIALVLGANIGTSVTAVLASLNTRREAKRVALAHTLFHVSGVLVFMWLIEPFAEVVRWVSAAAEPGAAAAAPGVAAALPRQIANAHTLFNVTITLALLPVTGPAARLVAWLLPGRPGEEEAPFKAVYLDESMLGTPAFALSLARSAVLRMGQLVKRMVEVSVRPFVARDAAVLPRLDALEEEVNFLEERIDGYLARISQRNVSEGQIEEAFRLMYAVTELEQIADIVMKTIRPRARQWLETPYRFSAQGDAEIRDMHLRTVKQVARALNLLRELRPEQAARMRQKYQKYRAMELDFMRSHFERLRRAVPESVATNEFHHDLMEQLVRITSHATNIARLMLHDEPGARAPAPAAPSPAGAPGD